MEGNSTPKNGLDAPLPEYSVTPSEDYIGLSLCRGGQLSYLGVNNVYWFPVISPLQTFRDKGKKIVVPADKLTYTEDISVKVTLWSLKNSSPYKAGSFDQKSIDSENSEFLISIRSCEESFSSCKDSLGKPSIDEVDKEAILNIQRRMYCEDQNVLNSITPASSYESQEASFSSEFEVEEVDLSEIVCCAEDSNSEGSIQIPKVNDIPQGRASHNLFAHRKPSFYRPFQKHIPSISIYSGSLVQENTLPDPYSPLQTKLVTCKSTSNSITEFPVCLELCSALPFTGFFSAGWEKAFLGLFSKEVLEKLKGTVWVSCGYEHCAAVSSEGEVRCWGLGDSGCLGIGSTETLEIPRQVKLVTSIKYVECGGYHTLAVSPEGDLYSWGRGEKFQLGIDPKKLSKDEFGYVALSPLKVDIPAKVESFACGKEHSLVLDCNKNTWSFGSNEWGQLGVPFESLVRGINRVGIENATKLACGANFSVCLKENEVYVWGDGSKGQLGLGLAIGSSFTPRKVPVKDTVDLVCGENSVICVGSNLKILTWGETCLSSSWLFNPTEVDHIPNIHHLIVN